MKKICFSNWLLCRLPGGRRAYCGLVLRTLFKTGIRFDLVEGASAGAVNTPFLGLNGFPPKSLKVLKSGRKNQHVAPNPVQISLRGICN